MKNKRELAISLVFIVFFLISAAYPTHAQIDDTLDEGLGQLEEGKAKAEELKDTLTDEETSTDFLKKRWEEVFSKNKYTAPAMSGLKKSSPFLNSFFRYTVGMEPSLSFLFALNVIIWVTLVILLFKALSIVSLMSKKFQYLASFGVIIIISILGLTKTISESIINLISLFQLWYIKLLAYIIVVLLIIISWKIEKILSKISKKAKKDAEEEKAKGATKVVEAYAEEITKD